nr:hypothetical protein [Alloscardovia omnicolens]
KLSREQYVSYSILSMGHRATMCSNYFQEIGIDYDANSPIIRGFYQAVHNRCHYAATGHTVPVSSTKFVFKRAYSFLKNFAFPAAFPAVL